MSQDLSTFLNVWENDSKHLILDSHFGCHDIYFEFIIKANLHEKGNMLKGCFNTQTHFHKCGRLNPNTSKWFPNLGGKSYMRSKFLGQDFRWQTLSTYIGLSLHCWKGFEYIYIEIFHFSIWRTIKI
jgi:hypothetical protein